MAARTGRPIPDIARAYALARDVFGVLEVNLAIDALDNKVGGSTQLGLYAASQQNTTERMLWFLRNVDFTPGLANLVKRFRKGVVDVSKAQAELLSEETKHNGRRLWRRSRKPAFRLNLQPGSWISRLPRRVSMQP